MRALVVILIFVLVSTAVWYIFFKKKDSKENFGFGGLPSMTWKVQRVMADDAGEAAKGKFYSLPGGYQSMLTPRFGNVDYGAHIRYNMPSKQNQAVPSDPMSEQVESYYHSSDEPVAEGYATPSCGAYAAGNYNEVRDEVAYPEVTDSFPLDSNVAMTAASEGKMPIVYDRFIYANRSSRLRSMGDPIRGDLPIVPCSSGWFAPSAHPNIDLQTGAMNVLGGVNNETSKELAALIQATSGQNNIGGVHLQDAAKMYNMVGGREVETANALADVQVTAFP